MGQVVADVGVPVAMEGNVGGSALLVVASLGASHSPVQGWGAVARADGYGLPGMCAQGFEYLLAEAAEVGYERLGDAVVDT